jgi:HPt (histidine-containing phosphotransfer) domain-containing protein
MAEQIGHAVAALQARQAALARQHSAAAEADRVLAEALAVAYAETVEGASRLDEIAAEIEDAVRNQAALAVDTPMGAREFQRFLIDKQREIIAVVSHAHTLDEAKKTALESLRSQYAAPAG